MIVPYAFAHPSPNLNPNPSSKPDFSLTLTLTLKALILILPCTNTDRNIAVPIIPIPTINGLCMSVMAKSKTGRCTNLQQATVWSQGWYLSGHLHIPIGMLYMWWLSSAVAHERHMNIFSFTSLWNSDKEWPIQIPVLNIFGWELLGLKFGDKPDFVWAGKVRLWWGAI